MKTLLTTTICASMLLASPAFAKEKLNKFIAGIVVGAAVTQLYQYDKAQRNLNPIDDNVYSTDYYEYNRRESQFNSERQEYYRGVQQRRYDEQQLRNQHAYECGYTGRC